MSAHGKKSSLSAEAPLRLEDANKTFHEVYTAARECEKTTEPVFILLGGELTVHRNETRECYPVHVPLFDILKTAAHLAVAVVVARTTAPPAQAQAFERIRRSVDAARQALRTSDAADPRVEQDVNRMLDFCLQSDVDPRVLGPPILNLTNHATRTQVDVLHRQTERALVRFSERERETLQVIVAGDHQARAESLEMQYFRRRLGEAEGVEHRVAYAEGVSTEEGALALAGTRRLDRALAEALFSDARRLQRDVLGDAARSYMASLDLTRI